MTIKAKLAFTSTSAAVRYIERFISTARVADLSARALAIGLITYFPSMEALSKFNLKHMNNGVEAHRQIEEHEIVST